MAQLQPRREVWEYGTLPMSILCPSLDSSSLVLAHSKLLTRSSVSHGGERTVGVMEVSRMLDLASGQAEVLIEILAALSLQKTELNAPQTVSHGGHGPIILHELTMFLLAQLFSKEAQRADSVEYWPEGAPASQGSELLSPTRQFNKTLSSGRTLLRQQLQQHLRNQHTALRGYGDYLRRNLKLILELAQDPTPPSEDPFLITAKEVDRISFLFKPLQHRQVLNISALVSGFQSSNSLTIDQVLTNLRQTWFEETLDSPRLSSFSTSSSPSPKAFRSIGLAGPSGQVEESRVSGVFKGTVVRGESDCPSGQLHITDCHDTVIYALAPLQWVYISGCSDCTIVMGAVGTLLRLDRCDKLQVIAACNRMLASSCHDCSLYLGIQRPPVLMGDNRFLRLAPFNTRYDRQLAHARAAGLRLDMPNKWDSPIQLIGRDRRGMSAGPDSPRSFSMTGASTSRNTFTLLPPEEFMPYVVPFSGGPGLLAGGPAHPHSTKWSMLTSSGNGVTPSRAASSSSGGSASPAAYLFPLPPDYDAAMQRKLSLTADMRQKFKQVGLPKEKERELNDAIQAHFREWLQSTNLLRQIYDLSNLERDESSSGVPPGLYGSGQPPAPK
ncbi:hypothetical protein CEUSTIGMA_g11358.t1 [Chlamydomonas eustigma]|uniref:C-CAP/cofactor C-like domain-containing protein n=1 Tax=Chlamydomonas eustigma TaxID=1157962 RepID=A0A250XLI7_9CHLO|nr:hypothetical protein CEUSTIGMA_g11358.t1 [Chlamydomonas eustigma]|eukprot:GAX83934.1 hypothetical protein CEUSTIGMA_g11358.t1 [Chlamydomonas eustigma]